MVGRLPSGSVETISGTLQIYLLIFVASSYWAILPSQLPRALYRSRHSGRRTKKHREAVSAGKGYTAWAMGFALWPILRPYCHGKVQRRYCILLLARFLRHARLLSLEAQNSSMARKEAHRGLRYARKHPDGEGRPKAVAALYGIFRGEIVRLGCNKRAFEG